MGSVALPEHSPFLSDPPLELRSGPKHSREEEDGRDSALQGQGTKQG